MQKLGDSNLLCYKKKNPVEQRHCETSSSYWGLLSGETKASEGKVIFILEYDYAVRDMKTKNRNWLFNMLLIPFYHYDNRFSDVTDSVQMYRSVINMCIHVVLMMLFSVYFN